MTPSEIAQAPAGPAPAGGSASRLRFLIFGVTWASWTITVYALGQIVAMPVAGALSDSYGRKRLFLGAVVVFTAASLCCGLSTNIYELVILRALQALGGGAFIPSATGIVCDQFGAGRDRAIGMFTGMFRQAGGISGISIASAVVARSSHPGLTQATMFAVLAVILVLMIPLTFGVPEHRGTW